jgi:hypothetical protein
VSDLIEDVPPESERPLGLDLVDNTLPLPLVHPTLASIRERQRGWFAGGLLVILGLVVAGSFVTLWSLPQDSEALLRLLGMLFAPIVALVAGAVGFYYGAESKPSNHR